MAGKIAETARNSGRQGYNPELRLGLAAHAIQDQKLAVIGRNRVNDRVGNKWSGNGRSLADVSAPKVDELTDSDSKDKLLAAVRSSFDFCSSSLANTDDSNLGDPIEFFGRQGPRAMAAFILTGGWSDHYSAAAMYLRLNGILPPTAQPKK